MAMDIAVAAARHLWWWLIYSEDNGSGMLEFNGHNPSSPEYFLSGDSLDIPIHIRW